MKMASLVLAILFLAGASTRLVNLLQIALAIAKEFE